MGDDGFDDDEEDGRWVAIGRLGGRRGTREVFTWRNESTDGGCVLWLVTVKGRIKLWVERDLVMYFVDVDVGRTGTGGGAGGGVDDEEEPSRSFFMELEVCAAYDGRLQ